MTINKIGANLIKAHEQVWEGMCKIEEAMNQIDVLRKEEKNSFAKVLMFLEGTRDFLIDEIATEDNEMEIRSKRLKELNDIEITIKTLRYWKEELLGHLEMLSDDEEENEEDQ